MKKQISILLSLLLVFLSLIVSCDDGSGDLDSNICKITVSSGGNGSVSITNYIGTSENVLLGSNIEVVATPDEGCGFLGWFVGEAEKPVSTDAEYTFTVSESVTLVAKFAKLQNLTINKEGNGNVSFKGISGTSNTLLPGSEVTVIAIPGEGSEFVGWFVGEAEEPISTDAEYTFTVSESVTLVAKFNQLLLVSLSCNRYGTVSFADSAETSQYTQPGSEVTVIAIPGEGSEFLGWFVGDAETAVSIDSEYTFTVSESVTLVAKFTMPVGEAIDLGLSVKWASFNVGASNPEEYGDYFAWGEISPKSSYDSSNCVEIDDISGNAQYDAARANWGGDWRVPTKAEQDELCNNCTWEWTTLNGVNGYKVTGSNGNSIFLPAAGYRYVTYLFYEGSEGYYWSSTPYEDGAYSAYYLGFDSGNFVWSDYRRLSGQSVRPVCE